MSDLHKIYHVKGGSRETWYIQRQALSGIGNPDLCRLGASEVSTVINGNKYESPIKLFYNKIGMYITQFKSERMSAGLYMEPVIQRRYETFDLDVDIRVDNMEAGRRVKKLIKPNYFLLNDKYPQLFSSMDMVCPANQLSFFTGENIPFGFPVEFKNVVYDSFKSWNGDVSQMYRIQNNVQQMVFGVDYGEIAVLVDGWNQFVFPIDRDPALCDMIDYRTREFCEKVVLAKQIREVWLEAERNGEPTDEFEDMVQACEPEVDGLDSTNDFLLNDLYPESEEASKILATEEIEQQYDQYLLGMSLDKMAKEKKQLAQNTFLDFMGENENIVFKNHEGKIIYRRNSNKKAYFSVR